MIHLDSNAIGDAGAIALAEALGRGAPVGELGLDYNRLRNAGAEAIAKAARASAAPHACSVDHNQMVDGTGAAAAAELNAEMRQRRALAAWLVEAELAQWLGATGPPLLSPFATPVRELQAHTSAGLLALRHTDEAQLAAHAALATLDAAQRGTLVRLLLRKVGEATAHDEL